MQGYKGDGISCIRTAGGSDLPTANPNPSGLDLDIYVQLTEGQCSVMGFEWENLKIMLKKMQWSKAVEQNRYFLEQILGKYQILRDRIFNANIFKSFFTPIKIKKV